MDCMACQSVILSSNVNGKLAGHSWIYMTKQLREKNYKKESMKDSQNRVIKGMKHALLYKLIRLDFSC